MSEEAEKCFIRLISMTTTLKKYHCLRETQQKRKEKQMDEHLKRILSPKEKEVFRYYKEELTYEEIMEEMQVENPKIIDNAIQRVKRKISTIETITKQIEHLKGKTKEKHKRPTVSKKQVELLEETYNIQFPLDYLMFAEEVSNGYEFENGKVYSIEESIKMMELNLIPLLSFRGNVLSYQTKAEMYYLNEKPIQTTEGIKTYQSFVRKLTTLLNEDKTE